MEWEIKLICIYYTVCDFFSQTPIHKKIRKSPNQILEFIDEEVITIFIFDLMEGHKNLKNILNRFNASYNYKEKSLRFFKDRKKIFKSWLLCFKKLWLSVIKTAWPQINYKNRKTSILRSFFQNGGGAVY